MKLIVGLGNPGIEYQFTPHNLGFLAIDRIASDRNVEVRNRQCRALTGRTQIGDEQVLLAKPETFMNLSGLAVRELLAEDSSLANRPSDYVTYYACSGTPLRNAAAAGHMEIVTLLLAAGADPNLPEEEIAPRGHALHSAVCDGHSTIWRCHFQLTRAMLVRLWC